MGAAGFLVRGHVRRHGRAAVLFAVVVGLACGAVVAAVAGARRTQTSLDRFAAHSRLPDLAFFGPLSLIEKAERLPMVAASARSTYVPLSFVDVPENERERLVPFVSLDGEHLRNIERPYIVDGRLPHPNHPYEIAVSEKVADRRNAAPGAVLRAQTFLADDLDDFTPSGPTVRLRVTGVVRQLADLTRTADDQGDFVSGEEMVYLTPAFWRAHTRVLPQFGEQAALLVRLRDPRAAGAFQRAVVAANGGTLPGDSETAGFYSPNDQLASVGRAIDVETVALYAFAMLIGLAVVVAVGQAVGRRAGAAAADYPQLTAIGLTSRQMVAAAAIRDGTLGLVAALVAVALAAGLSPLTPIGFARRAEPDPGLAPNLLVLAAGAATVVIILAAASAAATHLTIRAGRRQVGRDRPSTIAGAMARSGASAPAVIGTRFALEPGRGPTSVPVRTTLAAAVLGTVAVVAAFTFGAGFRHVLRTSSLQGAPWDLSVTPDPEGDVDARAVLGADRRVAQFATSVSAETTVGSIPLVILGIDRADFMPPASRGRLPTRSGEIALSQPAAARLDVGVGDRIRVGPDRGPGHALRVVGIAPVAAQVLADRAGEGAITTLATARAVGARPDPSYLVRWRPGVAQQAARDDVQEAIGSAVRPFRSPDVRNLSRVSWLPYALSATLAVLSVATLLHALASAVQRRRRDLAILKTLGLDRRQVGRIARWQASAIAVVGAVVGLPVGVATGRWAWRLVGERTGVVAVQVVPWVVLAVAAGAILVLANLAAWGPARSAGRTRPAAVLRAEWVRPRSGRAPRRLSRSRTSGRRPPRRPRPGPARPRG
jgi:hypothetical protein